MLEVVRICPYQAVNKIYLLECVVYVFIVYLFGSIVQTLRTTTMSEVIGVLFNFQHLPFNIHTPKLSSQTPLTQAREINLSVKFRFLCKIALVDMILVESSNPDREVIVPI